jgi:hypothetical protein
MFVGRFPRSRFAETPFFHSWQEPGDRGCPPSVVIGGKPENICFSELSKDLRRNLTSSFASQRISG